MNKVPKIVIALILAYVLLAWIFCWFPFSLTEVCSRIPF